MKITNIFFWVCWFLSKNLSYFIFLPWKLENPNCHIDLSTLQKWRVKNIYAELSLFLIFSSGIFAMYSLIDTLTLEECTANVWSVIVTGFVCNINAVKKIPLHYKNKLKCFEWTWWQIHFQFQLDSWNIWDEIII